MAASPGQAEDCAPPLFLLQPHGPNWPWVSTGQQSEDVPVAGPEPVPPRENAYRQTTP